MKYEVKLGYLVVSVILVLAVCSLSQAADLLVEDFESYADSNALTAVWKERNPTVVTLSLETTEAKDGTQSMVIDYNCHNSPYWTEACRIFTTAQDWSAYNTLNVWIKGYIGAVPGHEPNQSQEDMYAVLYQANPAYPNPVDQSQLWMLGKVHVYRATKIADWTLFRFNLGQSFEPMTNVRAIGIGLRPDSYGAGIVKIDAMSLEEKSYGGIMNNFEQYADNNALQESPWINEGNSTNTTIELEVNDVNNIFEGEKSLKVSFNNGIDPGYTKVSFSMPRSIKYAWGPKTFNYGMNYNPLTVNFKVIDPEGRIQVVLIGTDYLVKATYHYPDEVNGPTYRVPAGNWIRWDINPQIVYNDPESTYTELDAVMRVEVQFIPIDGNDYGTGLVYLDDIHVNNCATGADNPSPTGDLRADLNKDCVIDFMDYAAFAEHWQQTGCVAPDYCGGADFLIGPSGGTRNGQVDFADLLIVTYRWLECNMLFQGDCF